MTPDRTLSWKIVMGIGAVALAGCTVPVEKLPIVDLSGGPAFPLDAHLESAVDKCQAEFFAGVICDPDA